MTSTETKSVDINVCEVCKTAIGFMGKVEVCSGTPRHIICQTCQTVRGQCLLCYNWGRTETMVKDDIRTNKLAQWYTGPYVRPCTLRPACGTLMDWETLATHDCKDVDKELREQTARQGWTAAATCPETAVCTTKCDPAKLLDHMRLEHLCPTYISQLNTPINAWFTPTSIDATCQQAVMSAFRCTPHAHKVGRMDFILRFRAARGDLWLCFVTTVTEAAMAGCVFVTLKTEFGTTCHKLKPIPETAFMRWGIKVGNKSTMFTFSSAAYIKFDGEPVPTYRLPFAVAFFDHDITLETYLKEHFVPSAEQLADQKSYDRATQKLLDDAVARKKARTVPPTTLTRQASVPVPAAATATAAVAAASATTPNFKLRFGPCSLGGFTFDAEDNVFLGDVALGQLPGGNRSVSVSKGQITVNGEVWFPRPVKNKSV